MTDSDPTDVATFVNTDYATGFLKTQMVRGRIEPEDAEFGLTIHQDGVGIALSAGTQSRSGGTDHPQLYTYQTLTPDQARELGDVLHDVADAAEDSAAELEQDDHTEGSKSLIRRLLP